MKFHVRSSSSRLSLITAACLLSLLRATPAQQPAPATPAPAAAAPDPKLLKQLDAILSQKFSKDPADVFRSIEHTGTADTASLNVTDRFLTYFRIGDWVKVREELAQMPPDVARKVYDKMLADLTEKPKPGTRLDDVLGLADAVPGDFTPDEPRKLGQLLGLSVPAAESYWISDRFSKGTARLGGSDPSKRILAGRVLLAGGFKDLARTYLPSPEQAEKIEDEGLRNEIMAFLTSQRESEAAQRGQLQKIWDENLRVLTAAKVNEWEKTKASLAIGKVITQIPLTTLAPVFSDMLKNNPDTAVRLISGLGRKMQTEGRSDPAVRVDNLKAQAAIANLLGDNVDLSTQPWNQLVQMMAELWEAEADTTFGQKTGASTERGIKFVSPEDMLQTAPTGKWLAALSGSARDRFDVSLSKVILAGANFDQAADRIVEIGKRSPGAGVALAEDFLGVWAKTNNPQIPDTLRKKYDLPEDARIPVTPIMMEKNIDSLARMMDLFRQAGIAPKDYEKVVAAFDLAYSSAEAYKTSHIEKVFGPIEKMDETLFFLILSRMNANLSERWRKMDVQRAGLTRRDETQTLEMVRAGYSGALGMIDGWLKGHPDGWRALTLAGSLLADWGDYEYFQELVTGDARKRMVGYKEKNLQAQDYFQRGADAYAKEVPKLAPGDYTVDAYMTWFNGLLGIGSNGQINLSKAMNRAALSRIREHLIALPGKAGAAHLTQFAKIVNARLADEKDPLHEDLKYRYLASALVITKDDPFTLGAEKKVAYFDQLLSEIRLQTRVDGPNTIGRDQEFGIIVSVVHTEAMGRVAQFGQYLSNDPNMGSTKPKKKSPLARKMREAQGPRDELELSFTEAFSPYFDIKSMTFATPEVKPRPTSKPGWEETVLAYILVKAKDASVDKIPPLQMELKFMDLTGPVTIPAESAETIIKVSSAGEPSRPAGKIEIAQTLDTRQFKINGGLAIEVKATSAGLVPELEQLVDLAPLKATAGVRNIDPHEGLQIKEINTWGDQVGARSERLWTIALDGDPIREREGMTEIKFPAPKAKDATAIYQTYNDMDLATLAQPSALVGRNSGGGVAVASGSSHAALWITLVALVALGIGGIAISLKRAAPTEDQIRARDVFKMPGEVDGFAVVALLRRLRSSPLVHLQEPQRQELQQDIQRVQHECFGADGGVMSESDLRGVAEKWLRLAC